jgi:hypothetical protein
VTDQVSHPDRKIGKFVVLYTSVFIFWITKWKAKDSAPSSSKNSMTSICSQFLYERNLCGTIRRRFKTSKKKKSALEIVEDNCGTKTPMQVCKLDFKKKNTKEELL